MKVSSYWLVGINFGVVAMKIPKSGSEDKINTDHYGKHFVFGLTAEPAPLSGNVYITIIGTPNTSVSVEYDGQVTTTTMNGKRTNVRIRGHNPIMKAGKIEKKGMELSSSKPVAVVCSYEVKLGVYEGYIVLPTKVLGRKYVITGSSDAKSSFSVISLNDNTTVSIHFSGNGYAMYEGDVQGAGIVLKVSLNKLQTLRLDLSDPSQGGDLSGTIITASNRVTVISGSSCYSTHCNYAVVCLLPVAKWGKKHVVVSRGGIETWKDKVRVFAYEKTVVNNEGDKITRRPREFFEMPLEKSSVNFINCSKPCQVMQYVQGENVTRRGPSLFWVSPVENFRKFYRIIAAGIPIFNVGLLTRKSQNKMLIINNRSVNISNWNSMRNTQEYVWEILSRTCNDTTISSSSPFGLIMLGWTTINDGVITIYKSFFHLVNGYFNKTNCCLTTPEPSVPTKPTKGCKNLVCQLSKKPINATNAAQVSRELTEQLSHSARNQTSDDISDVADIIENIAKIKEPSDEVVENVLTAINSVLDVSLDVLTDGQRETNTSARILQSLDDLLAKVNVTEGKPFQRTFDNLEVDVSLINTRTYSGITFGGTTTNTDASLGDISPKTTSIRLPKTLFNETNINQNSSTVQTVIMKLFKETKFFEVNSTRISTNEQRLNSFVIAGDIKGVSVTGLKNPVVLTYAGLREGNTSSSRCVFWNPEHSRWFNNGCTFEGVLEDGTVVCHCNHLTNFAILMDIDVHKATPHEKVLGIISYIGCALSLVGLILTMLTILLFRDLRSNAPTQILLNFCLALSLTLVVFIVGAERSRTPSMAACRVAAIALHYLVLATFMWMAIAAFNMYLAFVKVLNSYFPKFMLKCSIVGWGVPLLIVAITMAVSLHDYGDSTYCRLLGIPFMVAFLAPTLIILAGNSIAFILIFHSLMKTGSKVTADLKVTGYQQARQGVAISVLLGLTWLFGILAVGDAKLVFQYLFCIFNSLQGLFVFLLYCLLSPSTRDKYRRFISKKLTYRVARGKKSRGNTSSVEKNGTETHTNDIEIHGATNPYTLSTDIRSA